MLLLDEATSALDATNQKLVAENIEKELEAELKAHKEAGTHKDRIAGFKLKMRSVTHFIDHKRMGEVGFSSADAHHRITEVRKARLLGDDDDAFPSVPMLDRAHTVN